MTCGGESVGVEEAADFGIVVSALQVIEAGFGVVDIAAVAQGVMGTEGGSQVAGCYRTCRLRYLRLRRFASWAVDGSPAAWVLEY